MATSLNYDGRLRADDAPKLLVPGYAAKVPAAVAKANDMAAEKVTGLQRADQAWAAARDTAEAAAGADARAAAMAHRDGGPLPEPTEAAAKAAFESAARTRTFARREADQAIGQLHDVIADTRDRWQAHTEAATDDATAAVHASIDQLREALAQQAAQAAVEWGLRRFDPAAESQKVRTLYPVGPVHERPERLLAELAEAVDERATRPVTPTEVERRQAEEFQATTRGLRQMASGTGGVHVS